MTKTPPPQQGRPEARRTGEHLRRSERLTARRGKAAGEKKQQETEGFIPNSVQNVYLDDNKRQEQASLGLHLLPSAAGAGPAPAPAATSPPPAGRLLALLPARGAREPLTGARRSLEGRYREIEI